MTDHLYAPVLLAISESAWSKMSESQQQALLAAVEATEANSPNVCAEYTDKGLETIRAAGVEINEVDRAAIEEAIKPLHDELNVQFDGALDAIKALQS